jgi:hypothetical protein
MLAVALIQVSAAAAQPTQVVHVTVPLTSFVSCDQTPPADDASDHCGLRYEHHTLMRGPAGTVLGRDKFLRPAPISKYVLGDSARIYAARYERDELRGARLALFGFTALFHSVSLFRQQCQAPGCPHDAVKVRATVFLVGGVGLTGAAIHYIHSGTRAALHALSLSNALLPHRGS